MQEIMMNNTVENTNGTANAVSPDMGLAVKAEAMEPVTVKVVVDLASLVPDGEKAVEQYTLPVTFENAKKVGLFSPAVGMGQILNRLDGQLYAAIRIGERGERLVQYCQRYADGLFSPKMEVKQSELLMWKMLAGVSTDRSMKQQVTRFVMAATKEYLGKFDSNEVPLNPIEVMSVLAESLQKLPRMQEADSAPTPEQLYAHILKILQSSYVNPVDSPEFCKDAYIIIPPDVLDRMAEGVGMTDRKLLKLMKEYHFLYLTDSCVGYQAYVPIVGEDGTKSYERAYCLRRLDFVGNQMMRESNP